MIIYKITNNINGNIYIGQTRNPLRERYRQHLQKVNNGTKTRLYNAMRKYGIINFSVEIVEELDDGIDNAIDVLNEREKYWINYYDATGRHGYNMTHGGDSNPMDCDCTKEVHDNKMRSQKVRESISKSMKEYRKNNPFTEEHRRNLSIAMKGNHNFGNGDTRSIGVYCIDEYGKRHNFHSIKDATVWWFNNYKPFGDRYVLITLQRKIRASIDGKLKLDIDWFMIE